MENKWIQFNHDGKPLVVRVTKARPYRDVISYGFSNKVEEKNDIELLVREPDDNEDSITSRDWLIPFEQDLYENASSDVERITAIQEEIKRLTAALEEEASEIKRRINYRVYSRNEGATKEQINAAIALDPSVDVRELRDYQKQPHHIDEDKIFDPDDNRGLGWDEDDDEEYNDEYGDENDDDTDEE